MRIFCRCAPLFFTSQSNCSLILLPPTQCAIPAFEGLLPEPHNSALMNLLFIFAQWHALAKLRLHNDHTLALLDYTTTQLGALTRRFDRDTCSKVETKELAKEAEARACREAKGKGKGKAVSSARKPATLGIFTIKFHFLGDYVSTIRRFGTSDSYSTENVSSFSSSHLDFPPTFRHSSGGTGP